jgi:hypothetical protein
MFHLLPVPAPVATNMKNLEEENARLLAACRMRDPSPVGWEARDLHTLTKAEQDAYTRAPWLRWGPYNRTNLSSDSSAGRSTRKGRLSVVFDQVC